jgi:flagellar hook assembly protein FlgD
MTKNNTMKKNLLIAVGVLLCTGVFAGGIKDPVTGLAIINKTGTSTYKVFYKNSESSNVKISIIDSNNKVVFKEKLSNVEGFVRPYNFSELAEGEYTLQIEDNSGIRKEQVSYRSGRVKNLFNVVRLAETNKYLVTAPGKWAETVTVKIYNQDGEILHNESSNSAEAFARVYKLEKVSGSVTFEITDSTGASKILTF